MYGRIFIEFIEQAIQTEAHAVWISPDGFLKDVTPSGGRADQSGTQVLFAPDPKVQDFLNASPSYHLLLSRDPNVRDLYSFEQSIDDWERLGVQSIDQERVLSFPALDRLVRESPLPTEVTNVIVKVRLERLLMASPTLELPRRYADLVREI